MTEVLNPTSNRYLELCKFPSPDIVVTTGYHHLAPVVAHGCTYGVSGSADVQLSAPSKTEDRDKYTLMSTWDFILQGDTKTTPYHLARICT